MDLASVIACSTGGDTVGSDKVTMFVAFPNLSILGTFTECYITVGFLFGSMYLLVTHYWKCSIHMQKFCMENDLEGN